MALVAEAQRHYPCNVREPEAVRSIEYPDGLRDGYEITLSAAPACHFCFVFLWRKRRYPATAYREKPMPRRSIVTLVRVSLLLLLAGTAARASDKSIQEARYVKIGGIEQWITIKGADRRNPVVLFLNGGPGNSLAPFADAMFAGWEKDLTLVQWDQRGAGRTFIRNGKSIEPTLTLERMSDDGIEVSEFLRQHLHTPKIMIVGMSWGSILGVRMAKARPDLFSVYVGAPQAVCWAEDLAASYARLQKIAQSKGDQPALDTLRAIGPPPWSSLETWSQSRKVIGAYQAELATAPFPPFVVASEYAPDASSGVWAQAASTSWLHFFGPTGAGPLTKMDLRSLGTRFAVPLVFIQGEQDLMVPSEQVRAYFDSITAPSKQFLLAPGTAHNTSLPQLELLHRALADAGRQGGR